MLKILQTGTIFAEKVFHSVKRGSGIIVKPCFRHYRYKKHQGTVNSVAEPDISVAARTRAFSALSLSQ
jgi:hypothetical protein